MARVLYEEIYSDREVIVKNTTEKETMDTGQYHVVYNMVDVKDKVVMMVTYIDLDRTASRAYYVGLDSRAASEVYGVQTLDIYNLVRETEIVYYSRDNWDQSKFEDQDHRMVTTMFQNVRSDYISDLGGTGLCLRSALWRSIKWETAGSTT